MSENTSAKTTADQIIKLECDALDRWGKGDPGGFLEVYGADISYFDPLTAARIDGHQAMVDYYQPWTGKIQVARYEMLNPQVIVDGNIALLTYNLQNYVTDVDNIETAGSQWNSTTVYRLVGGRWKSIHSHWSFTRHTAFLEMSPQASEGL